LAALTFSNSAASYTLAQGSGGTLKMNGGAAPAALTDSAGSHTISAPVTLDTSAVVTVTNPGNTLAISGPISGSGGLTTGGPGTVVLTANNTFTGGTTISAGTLALGNGGAAGSLTGNVTNNSVLVLNLAGNQFFSANVSGSGSVVANGPGTLVLQGNVSAGQITVNQAEIAAAAGSTVSGDLTVSASGNFTNNGSTAYLGDLTNSGILAGNAQVGGSFVNQPTGSVRLTAGQSLFLQSTSPQSNASLISVIGTQAAQALFESVGPLTNAAGGTALIAGQNATITLDTGLTNQGAVAFSNGINNVFGTVMNAPSGSITVTGGASVTFWGDVAQNGTLVVSTVGSTHSSAVFLGAFTGGGGFTGGGDVFIEGDLRPGDGPAVVLFESYVHLEPTATTVMELGGLVPGSQYDRIDVSGLLSLGGGLDVELIDGFTPAAGESFQLFNGNMSGTFSQVSLPALSNGLSWDRSHLYSTGEISVVPEPSTLALLGVGAVTLAACTWQRRRRARHADSSDDVVPATLRFPWSGARPTEFARRAA
jgi:autotransporter-associated beta strand protein